MKVLTVVGNRPQFIKSAPLSLAFRDAGIGEVVLHTGQHWDDSMSGVFFNELGLDEPAYRLDLHTADVEAMRPGIRAAVEAERPDWVVVLGDTNSTLAGAEAARDTPIAHVEAGLRSGDLDMPEERNRIAVDRIAALLLCPDERSVDQLAAEGVAGRAEVVGDVMADATRLFAPLAPAGAREPGTYLLCTVHREANVRPGRLARIVQGLNRLEEPVVFPAHPRTRSALAALSVAPHVELVEPLGYLELAGLASRSRVILTDSGGRRETDAILVALPTPLSKQREPDLAIVKSAVEGVAQRLRKGHLVVLESTTYPYTTREVVLPILERSGLEVGEDFCLAFSPERVDPGRTDWTTRNVPKIVGGITEACTKRAAELYGAAVESVHAVSSPEAAELTKLLENIFRSVNIALVNELAQLCERMGIDVWEVVEAAATKPFGFMSFAPGPGLGGHSIPIDPFYLTWKARE